MVYEWDIRRARRTRMFKHSLSLLTMICIVGLPAWIAVHYGFVG